MQQAHKLERKLSRELKGNLSKIEENENHFLYKYGSNRTLRVEHAGELLSFIIATGDDLVAEGTFSTSEMMGIDLFYEVARRALESG